MNTVEIILYWLNGPCLFFALAVAAGGLTSLACRHIILIAMASYNAGKQYPSYRQVMSVACISLLSALRTVRPGWRTLASGFMVFLTLALIPFFLLDHAVLLNNLTGIEVIAFSQIFAWWLSWFGVGWIVFRLIMVLKRKKGPEVFSEVFFWSLVLLAYASGLWAASANAYRLLKALQIIHGVSGNLLLVLLPFSLVRRVLIFPIVLITERLGVWALPVSGERNETLDYFKRLRAGR